MHLHLKNLITLKKTWYSTNDLGTHSDHRIIFDIIKKLFMYKTENTMSADLKVPRQKYTTGARINYIPSSIHSQMGSIPK